jgi:hypothetical protein
MGRAVDLLNACELVLSVHQRLEGATGLSSSSLSGNRPPGAMTGTGRVGGGSAAQETPQQLGLAASSIKTSLRSTSTSSSVSQHPGAASSRGEEGAATTCSEDRGGAPLLPPLQVSGTTFMRDGILMAPVQVWGPLLLFLMEEVRRRQMPDAQRTSQDIEKLVGILQRSENHLLAIRVLLTSWSSYTPKKQVSNAVVHVMI